ncbi:hypothetical protein EV683_10959 [Crenobacter luteus]|uniref:Uncharacterized protein n=1 Tax=Crenobacter luteus TaxID=1452487 RepID=A0A163DQQ5_9NEIS|nr:hypothetical protein [Crenobacter luteus]KZE35157.1 hypothetical protein AVW16_05135 [Crenobacter luteus]TCP12464.1 hypothetical protein EV683_10959 [Crenobacter luteus]
MAARPKKTQTGTPAAAKSAEAQRYARAEAACQALMQLFATMDKGGAFAAHETAQQYARVCALHYRKIRNGRVLSPGDFNLAVELCTAGLRALRALEAPAGYAGWPQAEALAGAERHAAAVLRDYRALRGR